MRCHQLQKPPNMRMQSDRLPREIISWQFEPVLVLRTLAAANAQGVGPQWFGCSTQALRLKAWEAHDDCVCDRRY